MAVDELKLILGLPFEVGDYYIVHPLTIQEIAEMGYTELQYYLNIFLIGWESFDINLDEDEKTDEKLYKMIRELFYESDEFFELFNKACNIFLKRPLAMSKKQSLEPKQFTRISKFFSKEVYGEMVEILNKQYLVSKKVEKKRKFANERARKLHEQLEKNKKKAEKYNKNKPQFGDLISSLRWILGMNKSEILELSLYELYDGLKRKQVIDKVGHLFTAIYSGSINPKSIDKYELDYMKHIEL